MTVRETARRIDSSQMPEDTGLDIMDCGDAQPAYRRPPAADPRLRLLSRWHRFFVSMTLAATLGLIWVALSSLENSSGKIMLGIGVLFVLLGSGFSITFTKPVVGWMHYRRTQPVRNACWLAGMVSLCIGAMIITMYHGPKPVVPTPLAKFDAPISAPVPAQSALLPATAETSTSSVLTASTTTRPTTSAVRVTTVTVTAQTTNTTSSTSTAQSKPAQKPPVSDIADPPVETTPPADDPDPADPPASSPPDDDAPPADDPAPQDPGQVVVPVDPGVDQNPDPADLPNDGIVAPPL